MSTSVQVIETARTAGARSDQAKLLVRSSAGVIGLCFGESAQTTADRTDRVEGSVSKERRSRDLFHIWAGSADPSNHSGPTTEVQIHFAIPDRFGNQ